MDFNKSMDMYISFEPTRQCNMNCSYCYNSDSNTTTPDNNKFITAMFLRRFEEVLKTNNDKSCEVDLLGGEPSISYSTVPLINKLINLSIKYNNLKRITVTTNGLELLYNIKDLAKSSIFNINLTYHNFASKKRFLKTISKYLLYFNSDQITMTINLYAEKFNMSDIIEILNFCNKNKISFAFIDIYVDNKINSIPSEIREFFYKQSTCDTRNSIDDYKSNYNKSCSMYSYNILFDGTISSSCGHNLKYENIKTSNIIIGKPVICNGLLCEGSAGISQRMKHHEFTC